MNPEKLLPLILSNMSEAVFLTDLTGRFTFICPNVHTIFGMDRLEVHRQGQIQSLLGNYPFRFDQLKKVGDSIDFETEVSDKHGRPHTILVSAKMVDIGEKGVLFVCRDISQRREIEIAWQESEKRFRKAFRAARMFAFEYNLEQDEVVWSESLEKIFRLAEHHFDNTLESFFELIHPEDRQGIRDTFSQTVAQTGEFEIEYRVLWRDGAIQWLRSLGEVKAKPGGPPEVINGVLFDVTERKRIEQEVELLLTISRQIHDSRDFNDALNTALRCICERTKWDYGEVWIPTSDGSALECGPSFFAKYEDLQPFREESRHINFREGQGLVGRVWQNRQPEWVEDISAGGERIFKRANLASRINLKAALAVPLIGEQGNLIAILAFFMREPHREDNRTINIVVSVSRQLGMFLNRKQSETRLRQLNEHLSLAIATARLGVWEFAPRKNIVRINEQIAEIFGKEKSFFVNNPLGWRDSVIPEDQPLLLETLKALYDGEIIQATEFRIKRPDGGLRTIAFSASPLSGHDAADLRLLGVISDVTEWQQRENKIREALREVDRLRERLERENTYLQEEIKVDHNFSEIIGSSPPIRKVLGEVELVAETNSGVLLLGETGTGKELFARAIHNLSKRSDHTLVKVNCAAFPEGLIESELFGHEKGAFTGASGRKPGKFELAHQGTLFLDEIGDLPVGLQAKLLRVLQAGEFERLGGTKTIKVDVRIIAATNRHLPTRIKAGLFREDLYFRLNVFPINIPPLRERLEDIGPLAKYFITIFNRDLGKNISNLSAQVLKDLKSYHWPGNVRELENVIERAMILSKGDTLKLGEWLMRESPDPDTQVSQTLAAVEKMHILTVLEQCGWRVSGKMGAAEILGLKPTTLESRMKRLGISRPWFTICRDIPNYSGGFFDIHSPKIFHPF
ncbi:MAG TPA: sigma 54-interacting transcriptional regulator [Calditrichia bacterium]|nr:sigma 54-interacting transcriptional regulator [Calditrichia bacterium]